MTCNTLFARARVLLHVYKKDTSLKLFKLRQISVISYNKLSDYQTTLSPFQMSGISNKKLLCAQHRVKLNYNEDAKHSDSRYFLVPFATSFKQNRFRFNV